MEYRLKPGCKATAPGGRGVAEPEVIWVEVSFTPLRGEEGALDAVLGSIREVTENRQLEERLQQNLERQEFLNRLNAASLPAA